MWADDERLLAGLAEAYRPAAPLPTEPSLTELVVLERAVAARHAPLAATSAPQRSRAGRRAVVALGALLTVAGAALAATTVTVGVPQPVRSAAYEAGVPGVEAPEGDEIERALGELEGATGADGPSLSGKGGDSSVPELVNLETADNNIGGEATASPSVLTSEDLQIDGGPTEIGNVALSR